jgi:glycosyltransferase involved in cell wall biosynthesis
VTTRDVSFGEPERQCGARSNSPNPRPLVTLILFAYNQESYIRDAIEGAFSQNYVPLEIVLSDDCSTDRTFEIMRDMAEIYRGPHRLILSRTASNMGILNHFLQAAKQAHGEFVVVAAGDDVSLPERVETAVEVWRRTGAKAICSSWHTISETGEILEMNQSPRMLPITLSKYLVRLDGYDSRSIQGSTACYDRALIDLLPYAEQRVDSEDVPISFLINILGENIIYVDRALVLYRMHSAAIHNQPKHQRNISTVVYETCKRRDAGRMLNMLSYLLAIDSSCQFADRSAVVNRGQVLRDALFSEDRHYWTDYSILKRVMSVGRSAFCLSELKWKSARFFGRCPYYQPLLSVKPITAI